MRKLINKSSIEVILLLSVFSIFMGRAWQFLFWDAPYRTLFWDEELLGAIVESLFGVSWYEYVTSSVTDNIINGLVFVTGVVYLLAALSSLVYYRNKNRIAKTIIVFGGINLVFLSLLLMKDKYFQMGQFFEHSIQFSLPFLFVSSLKVESKKFVLILKLLIAIVFVSHGLYAVGYYPVPGKFLDMVLSVFPFSEENARGFLKFAGVLDFILAIAVFVPKLSKPALIYAMIWGFLTAFARIGANFQVDFFFQTIHQELYGTFYRLAHGLVPLMVLVLERKSKDS